MNIYLDVIWLLNFLFDGLLLLLTAFILKRKILIWRMVLGAFIGSLIVILMVSPLSMYASHPIIKLIFSFLIIGSAFGFKRFRYFIQNLLTFYFATFVVGGGMIGVHNFLEYEVKVLDGVLMTNTTGFGNPISWAFVLVGFPVLWYFTRKQISDFEMKKIQFDQIAEVVISIESLELRVKGLIDSGNQLYDPITKSPVLIVDTTKTVHFFPESIIRQSKNIEALGSDQDQEAHKWESRIRIIPYRGVGQDHQFLLAIKPDKITIFHNGEQISVTKGLIALNHTPLSSDGEYECIVHPKMLLSSTVQPAS
ncbi:sigma-E processing peptidase SpoIIGA [Bacillus luteolus]|uniref:Sporulation sigma-E factor-processing peptidase n=1 Tax=Litchfieldia luteola TaxID=682179 RepID=A0ABR9QJY0_9BACI|nr:sigma-E processing peptidase SpoIIGA [Cytobacillus luteolus]MBE4908811.1 sigma-E processing peptidase SpoIIGA [Cytobacillus luteolus]MBP1941669.1 stage II sporulation protein GA (sporulation sigma-E factor processing peptidase) [Cytobacillus luteolus]